MKITRTFEITTVHADITVGKETRTETATLVGNITLKCVRDYFKKSFPDANVISNITVGEPEEKKYVMEADDFIKYGTEIEKEDN